jgi:hypothetical protein
MQSAIAGTSVNACVDALQNAFTLPTPLYQRWTEITGRPDAPDPSDHQTYPRELEPLLGNLTIELEGGYKTVIPHYELINPDRRAILNDNGQYDVVENSSCIQSGVITGPGDYGENFGILLGMSIMVPNTF